MTNTTSQRTDGQQVAAEIMPFIITGIEPSNKSWKEIEQYIANRIDTIIEMRIQEALEDRDKKASAQQEPGAAPEKLVAYMGYLVTPEFLDLIKRYQVKLSTIVGAMEAETIMDRIAIDVLNGGRKLQDLESQAEEAKKVRAFKVQIMEIGQEGEQEQLQKLKDRTIPAQIVSYNGNVATGFLSDPKGDQFKYVYYEPMDGTWTVDIVELTDRHGNKIQDAEKALFEIVHAKSLLQEINLNQ